MVRIQPYVNYIISVPTQYTGQGLTKHVGKRVSPSEELSKHIERVVELEFSEVKSSSSSSSARTCSVQSKDCAML